VASISWPDVFLKQDDVFSPTTDHQLCLVVSVIVATHSPTASSVLSSLHFTGTKRCTHQRSATLCGSLTTRTREEGLLLKTLDYNLGCPLPLHFLRRFSKATAADTVTHHLSKYVSPPTLNPSTPHHISRTHPLRITHSLPVCRRFACAMHTCVPKQPCHPRPIFAQDE
jgi:hypothetical protein